MAIPKRWSRTVGPERGNRIRVYEREPGGKLHAAVWDPERGKYTQTGLGHRDRERALRDVGELVRLRESGDDLSGPLKLGTMVARYLAESIYTRDGSLKTAQYMKGCAQFATYLIEWFGAETLLSQLTPDRMPEYAAARRSGKISGRPVGQTAVHTDLKLLKSMMTWATMVYENGRPLLDRNPLIGFVVPKEPNPNRPVVDGETVEKLLEVADRVSPLLPLLIKLMDWTGRRLGSVLNLRWDDFDFENKMIRWRAEHDKKRKTWVLPMKNDPNRAVRRHLAAEWLKRAYRYAKIERPRGGLWHPFRRKFATERKFHPLRDVADGGGWKDVGTLLKCYQLSDEDTIRAVMDNPKPLRRPGAN